MSLLVPPAFVPPALWPQMFRWLRELCEDWGCQLVLASGISPLSTGGRLRALAFHDRKDRIGRFK